GAEVGVRVDGNVLRHRDADLAAHGLHSADEAGCVTRGEQLLGVGAGARGAGRRELDVEAAVVGLGGAVTATGDVGLGGVQDFFELRHGVFLAVVAQRALGEWGEERRVQRWPSWSRSRLSSAVRSVSSAIEHWLLASTQGGMRSALSRSARPAGVRVMRTRRSSCTSRSRATWPCTSRRLSSGVSVPESRNSRTPSSETVSPSRSHSTSITRYWG